MGRWRQIPREQGRQLLEGTVKSVLRSIAEHVVKGIVDLIAPGLGRAIDGLQRIVKIARALTAVAQGSGEVGLPVFKAGGVDLVLDVHFGRAPDGREPPVTALVAPGGDGLFGGFEVTPARRRQTGLSADTSVSGRQTVLVSLGENGHTPVVLAEMDLAALQEPNGAMSAAAMREWAEQQLRPAFRPYLEDITELELVVIYDPVRRIGTWLQLSPVQKRWRLTLHWDSVSDTVTVDVARIVSGS